MSTTLTLAYLYQQVIDGLGQDPSSGTLSTVGTLNATDNTRFDPDGTWANGWLMDTTANSTVRIQSWTQATNQWSFFSGLQGAVAGDAYQLFPGSISPGGMLNAINKGTAIDGKVIRTLVRDETQTLTANQYQYTPNYDPANANAFFPGQVVQCSFLYWLGQPTREWTTIPEAYLIDDYTFQFPASVCDTYAGSPIRFQGYGPLIPRVTSATLPNTVLGTFDDPSLIDALVYSVQGQAWLIVASKKTSGESEVERSNAEFCFEQSKAMLTNWRRGLPISVMTDEVVTSGWRGDA